MGDGYRVPTLAEVFNLINKQIMVNIEVKAPHNDDVKGKYDYKLCIRKVFDLIISNNAMSHYVISSFDPDVLLELDRLNQ